MDEKLGPKPTHPIVEPERPGKPTQLPAEPEKNQGLKDAYISAKATEAAKQEVKKDVLIEKREADPKRDPIAVEKVILMGQINAILAEYGIESNIPQPHVYWTLLNRFRGL